MSAPTPVEMARAYLTAIADDGPSETGEDDASRYLHSTIARALIEATELAEDRHRAMTCIDCGSIVCPPMRCHGCLEKANTYWSHATDSEKVKAMEAAAHERQEQAVVEMRLLTMETVARQLVGCGYNLNAIDEMLGSANSEMGNTCDAPERAMAAAEAAAAEITKRCDARVAEERERMVVLHDAQLFVAKERGYAAGLERAILGCKAAMIRESSRRDINRQAGMMADPIDWDDIERAMRDACGMPSPKEKP